MRAWLGSGEAVFGEENKTVPAHVTYMGRVRPVESVYSLSPKLDSVKSSDSSMLRMSTITCLCSFLNASAT